MGQQPLYYTPGQIAGYTVDENGNIGQVEAPVHNGGSGDRRLGYQARQVEVDDFLNKKANSYADIASATNAAQKIISKKSEQAATAEYNKKLAEITNQENTRNSLAQQIAALAGGGNNQPSQTLYAGGTPNFNEATGQYTNIGATLNNYYSELDKLKTPSKSFDAKYYLSTYPDVARDGYYGARPEEHYNRTGKAEGRLPNKDQEDLATGVTAKKITELESKIKQEEGYNSLTKNISQLALAQNPAITALSAGNNFATSPLASKLNFQVSDQQIIDDYNSTKLGRLNSIVQQGNTQVAGIQQRLNATQTLLDQLPKNDPRYTSSKVYVDQLNSDLKSVTDAITGANTQIKEFKPIAIGTPEAGSQITSFREYLQLPEERATQQLRQIDPKSYETAVALGQRYRQMATAPIGETKSAQTEQLRSNLEQEAINQLALGSQLGAEEQRQYQQAARAAQTARGNIFGVAPAVEEAVTTGAAGEQRKLARYGAATQFLASGQNTSDALKADLAFRDALLQSRLGAASGFIAGGPSLYNLGQARTGAQQSAFQNYVQANQALPGQFGQAPSTSQPFYQAVDQGIPVNLTNTFANLYGSQANYLASTYGAQVGAISRQPTGAQQFGAIASGIGSLIPSFSFSR